MKIDIEVQGHYPPGSGGGLPHRRRNDIGHAPPLLGMTCPSVAFLAR